MKKKKKEKKRKQRKKETKKKKLRWSAKSEGEEKVEIATLKEESRSACKKARPNNAIASHEQQEEDKIPIRSANEGQKSPKPN